MPVLNDLTNWLSHPIVVAAAKRSGWDVNGDPAGLFQCLSEVLNEIEDKVPGLSFQQMLDGVNPERTAEERAAIAERLIAGGMEFTTAQEAVGANTDDVVVRYGNLAVKTSPVRAHAVSLLKQGKPIAEVSAITGLGQNTIVSIRSMEGLIQRKSVRNPDRSREIAAKYGELRSIKKTAKQMGCAPNTVRAAVAHVRRLEAVA